MANVRVKVTGGKGGQFHVLDLENTLKHKKYTPVPLKSLYNKHTLDHFF